jgi:hypothetical protein
MDLTSLPAIEAPGFVEDMVWLVGRRHNQLRDTRWAMAGRGLGALLSARAERFGIGVPMTGDLHRAAEWLRLTH